MRKWHLYRVRGTENQHRWVIVAQDQLTFKDLDKATFEDALQRDWGIDSNHAMGEMGVPAVPVHPVLMPTYRSCYLSWLSSSPGN